MRLTFEQASTAITRAMRDAEDYALINGKPMPVAVYELALRTRLEQVQRDPRR